MKDLFSYNRRKFLKTALTATVVTAVCPHIVLGKLEPHFKKGTDHIMGEYRVLFTDFPVLREIWGEVKIKIPTYLTNGFFPKVLVCHLPKEEFGIDFSCLEELCPHEGQIVYDLNPDIHLYRCSGHGSMFYADGKFHSGPAAKDLTKHTVRFDGGDEIFLQIPAITTVVLESDNIFYIDNPIPNPAKNLCEFKYGIEKECQIRVSIISLSGIEVMKIKEEIATTGNYTTVIDISSLPVGKYYIRMTVNNRDSHTVPLIIAR